MTSVTRRYVGMLVPPLPKKRNVKTFMNNMRQRTTGVFVQLRTRALNLFMFGLSRIAFLNEDPDLKDFLEIQVRVTMLWYFLLDGY